MFLQALSFLLALAVSLALTPIVRRLSFQLGKVAYPRDDRWNRRPTPILGGVGIFLAYLIAVIASLFFGGAGYQVNWGLLAGSGVMFLLGFIDDLKELTPPAKLVGQLLSAALVISLGYTTNFFTPRIADNLIAQIPNILLTFIWLVGISNAINLLDNMDGLAGGIVMITALILAFFFWRSGDASLFVLAISLAGAVLGFLVFNFPPAKIFMGDSGSMFMGFTLAVLAIARQPQASNVFAILGVPTLLFLLPILDTTLVTFTRLLRGQSPAQGGADHTSHRLIAFGLSERQTVLAMYLVALVSGILAAVLESIDYNLSLLLVPLLIMTLALLTAYLGRLKVVTHFPTKGSTSGVPQGSAITRLMVELTYRRRILEIIFDLFLIGIALYLAFWTRYGLALSFVGLAPYLRTLPIAVAAAYGSFSIFGVYRGVWRYVGIDELVRFAKAALGATAITAAVMFLLFSRDEYSLAIFGLFAVYLFLGLAGTRASFRILDRVSGRQHRPSEQRVLICGAGDAGEMALRWILMNPQLGYQPVGFLDGDPFKTGRRIHGVEILGGYNLLDSVLDGKQVDGIVMTADAANTDGALPQVIAAARAHGRWVRSLRLEFELIE